MKTIKIAIILLIGFFCSKSSFSQGEETAINFFNTQGIPISNIGLINTGASNHIYFDLSEISTGRLDIAHTNNIHDLSTDFRRGFWNQNNGNGSFGSSNSFYSTSNDNIYMKSVKFVQLRDNHSKRDVVILRDNALQVHWNDNNSITGVQQSVSNVSGTSMDAGNFNASTNRNDIAVINSSQVKIYKNHGDGTLETSPLATFNIGGSIIRVKQMNYKENAYNLTPTGDKDDLIIANGNTISIYLNDGSNGLTGLMSQFNAGFLITDLLVEDFDGDGLNDIVAAGGTSGSYVAKLFKNVQGVFVNGGASWVTTSSSTVWLNPKLAGADVDKDGLNDLIISSSQGPTVLFINSLTVNYFGTAPAQTIIAGTTYDMDQVRMADIYNTGGIALLLSGGRSPVQGQASASLSVFNTTNQDPKPAPPITLKDATVSNGQLRPRLVVNNRGDRDVTSYQIFKKKLPAANYTYYATITGNEFIDNNEFILMQKGAAANNNNCYYYAKAVDATAHISDVSNVVGYQVGETPSCECEEADLVFGRPGATVPEENVTDVNTNIKSYSISNYPNPFNPTTKINFSIPADSYVKVVVYNSVGQIVNTIVNEFKTTGAYSVDFNGSALSSGIYYYTLETNNFKETKKMLLVK